MKLKNSHVLLIVMSLFLLISIGSVCASDIAADSDMEISDDAQNVVLADSNDANVLSDNQSGKIATEVVAKDASAKNTEDVKIPVTVKGNSTTINVAKENLTVSEGDKQHEFTYNNSNIVLNNRLSSGNHSLIISYLGNDVYADSNATILLKVSNNYVLNAPSSVNANSTKKAIVPINVTGINTSDITKDDLKLTIAYKNGNDTVSQNVTDFDFKDGKITFDLDMGATSGNLTITFNDGIGEAKKTIPISYIVNAQVTLVTTTAEYASGEFKFKLTDIDNNNAPIVDHDLSMTIITGSINTGLTAKTNEEGIASFDNTNIMWYTMENSTINVKYHIPVGKQLVSLKGSGIVKFNEIKTNLTITKATAVLKAPAVKANYHTDKNFTVSVTNKKTGQPMKNIVLKIDMPQTAGKTYYLYTDTNGNARIAIKNLTSNVYDVTASINDTKSINKASVKSTITINPLKAKLSAKANKVSYNTGTTATIKVTDEKGNALSGIYVLVQLYTGSKHNDYVFQTNKKGKIAFSAPLSVGKHKMVVSTADTRYKAPSVTKQVTVTKTTGKLKAPKVTAYYRSSDNFVVKLTNTKKNNQPIYGANVNIKVFISSDRYYSYNGVTGADGKLKLQIDLNPGTYKIQVAAGENKNYTAKQITSKIVVKKSTAKLTPAKITAKKGVAKKFKVTATNKKTKKAVVGIKVKIKVYTGSKSKTYTVKTNSNGIAKLNTKSLSVGTHKVVVSSADKYCKASSAKSTIVITK